MKQRLRMKRASARAYRRHVKHAWKEAGFLPIPVLTDFHPNPPRPMMPREGMIGSVDRFTFITTPAPQKKPRNRP